MRKWMIVVTMMVLMPWVVSLAWMRAAGMESEVIVREAAGQAGNGDREAGQKKTIGYESTDGDGQEEENPDEGIKKETLENGNRDGSVEVGGSVIEGREEFVGEGGITGEDANRVEVKGSGQVKPRKILVERKGVRTYIDLEDYLPGLMVCQIDTNYEMEALKCQAVIARTYIHRLMDSRTEIYEEELDMDYLGEGEGYVGENREKLLGKLERCREAAEATKGVVMQYEGRCILPLFHGMSAGRTRAGETDFPYLQSVESAGDTKRTDYMETMEWSRSTFSAIISQITGATPVTEEELPGQIQTVKKDDAGYMVKMKIGAGSYSGDELQNALGLPSPCFSLEGEGDIIRARIRGRGHGYGLSQAGADDMAKSGWGYEDILNHYYKNISLIFE